MIGLGWGKEYKDWGVGELACQGSIIINERLLHCGSGLIIHMLANTSGALRIHVKIIWVNTTLSSHSFSSP